MTKVSIIMTCYNGEKYLRQAIKSIIAQTFKKWELIFFDNNSTDNSKKILYEFKDKRIFYFKNNFTLKLGAARNLAFKKCKGDLITFLDVDDLWNKNKLKLQFKKFQTNQNIQILYTKYYILKNKELIKKNNYKFVKGKCKNEIIFSYIEGRPLTAWLTLMIRKKAIQSLKYAFDKRLHISSDFDLIYRLSDFCNFDYLNKYLASYRIHEKNESKSNSLIEINELNHIFRKIKKDKVFKNNNIVSKFSEKLLLKKFFLDKIKNNKSNLKIKETNFFIYRLVYLLIKFLPKIILLQILKLKS